jgi:hypothetical protein
MEQNQQAHQGEQPNVEESARRGRCGAQVTGPHSISDPSQADSRRSAILDLGPVRRNRQPAADD